jgi:hypothetical protein
VGVSALREMPDTCGSMRSRRWRRRPCSIEALEHYLGLLVVGRLRRRMAAARDRALSHFDWPVIVRQRRPFDLLRRRARAGSARRAAT